MPYFALRSYQDAGGHYDGQIGSEETPQQWLEALWECTREWCRVLKPEGSLFVNLGDVFSGGQRFDSGFTAQDAAWLAGVIDSDGSISIRVDNGGRSHVAWTRVGQMRPEVVQRIGALTGVGQVFEDGRGVWNWNAAAQQARWVLERIWPWLRIKQRQALAAIDLMASKQTGQRKGKWNPIRDDELRHRETIRQAVLAWNRGADFPDYEPPPAALVDLPRDPQFIQPKSLLGLPWRYALGCIDQLGLILRAEVIWSKPNGLPESVTDRVRRSHETWFHMVKQPRYFAAVDNIREPLNGKPHSPGDAKVWADRNDRDRNNRIFGNPDLGKLPGSVWTVPTEPLRVPAHLGVDHFAAYPLEWPLRIIRGWSPAGICTVCGQGRRPVADKRYLSVGTGYTSSRDGVSGRHRLTTRAGDGEVVTITGEACACTPYTDAPTTPALILDPFGGTGTTALAAKALGRVGISVDLSHDYTRLAQWRTTDRGELAKAMRVEKPAKQLDGQADLFDLLDGGAA